LADACSQAARQRKVVDEQVVEGLSLGCDRHHGSAGCKRLALGEEVREGEARNGLDGKGGVIAAPTKSVGLSKCVIELPTHPRSRLWCPWASPSGT
jgi:hypothetical protein